MRGIIGTSTVVEIEPEYTVVCRTGKQVYDGARGPYDEYEIVRAGAGGPPVGTKGMIWHLGDMRYTVTIKRKDLPRLQREIGGGSQ